MHVVEAVQQREAEAFVREGEFGEAAMPVVAGEDGALAQVLAPPDAIGADAAGAAQPGDPDPLAHPETPGQWRRFGHHADDLVAGHQRQQVRGQLAVDDVQVGAADGAGAHPDQHVMPACAEYRQRCLAQGAARGVEQHGRHRVFAVGLHGAICRPADGGRCLRRGTARR
jgi:hypothetical protein